MPTSWRASGSSTRKVLPAGAEATDGYVDLELLDRSSRIARLEEQIALATRAAERVRAVESYLMKIRSREADRSMVAASQILAKPGLERPLNRVCRALGISERHLSRQFKSTVGLQPKVFMRIMRFQHAIRARRKQRLPWAAIAVDCGFSDQAHLIREVRAFSGQSPGKIVLDSGQGDSTFNGEGVSEFFDTVYM